MKPPLGVLLLPVLAGCAATEPTRPSWDEAADVALLRAAHPVAADLVTTGDMLAASGSLQAAVATFRQARGVYDQSALPWLRECEVQTALGAKREAVMACSAAMEREHSGRVVRSLVRALVGGGTAPTPTEVYEAMLIASKEHTNPNGGVTAAAADCDIATTIGDGVMLQRCAVELERLAPNDPATAKARDALLDACPPWRFWAGWGALSLVMFVTAADFARRTLRGIGARRGVLLAGAVLLSLGAVSAPILAATQESPPPRASLSKWPVDLEHPEANIPTEDQRNAEPLEFGYWLQDVALRGEHAALDGDHLAAAKFYGALAQAVPDRAVAWRKQCDEFEAAGLVDRAVNACGQALLREGALVLDYTHFVRLELAIRGPLPAKDVKALDEVIHHLREDPAGASVAPGLECEVATRTSNVAQLRECTRELAATAPNDPKSISYAWALAMAEGNFDEAKALVLRAETIGIPSESLVTMDRVAKAAAADHRKKLLFGVFSALLLGLSLAIGGRSVLRKSADAPAS